MDILPAGSAVPPIRCPPSGVNPKICCSEFKQGERVKVQPLPISKGTTFNLEHNLLLLFFSSATMYGRRTRRCGPILLDATSPRPRLRRGLGPAPCPHADVGRAQCASADKGRRTTVPGPGPTVLRRGWRGCGKVEDVGAVVGVELFPRGGELLEVANDFVA